MTVLNFHIVSEKGPEYIYTATNIHWLWMKTKNHTNEKERWVGVSMDVDKAKRLVTILNEYISDQEVKE